MAFNNNNNHDIKKKEKAFSNRRHERDVAVAMTTAGMNPCHRAELSGLNSLRERRQVEL